MICYFKVKRPLRAMNGLVHLWWEFKLEFYTPLNREIFGRCMGKTIENAIILIRMDEPIDESSLESNEYKVTEYWKASYHCLVPTENLRGEINKYREVINGINSTRNEEPKDIKISF